MSNTPQYLTLRNLAHTIEDTLTEAHLKSVWVVGEIQSISVNRNSGHCYLELVEKSSLNDFVQASFRGMIWGNLYRKLSEKFKSETGAELQAGLKILFACNVNFSAQYSLSLEIIDIDSNYTLGESEMLRKQTIATLQNEGIFDMNRQIDMPLIPQRLAIVSAENAAGCGDFLKQIADSPYKFSVELFNASMQGKETDRTVCAALVSIANREDEFDAIVIIRGGGSKNDLQWFDSYNICSYITQMPLPVITGIGHERDESIADMVAHTAHKTPTAVAAWIIDQAGNFYAQIRSTHQSIASQSALSISQARNNINSLQSAIYQRSHTTLSHEILNLEINNSKIKNLAQNIVTKALNNINSVKESTLRTAKQNLEKQNMTIKHIEELIKLHNPENILKLGFAMIKSNGKIVKNCDSINPGDSIEITLNKKHISATVNNIK